MIKKHIFNINEANFAKINWGSDEAKGDEYLPTFFLKIPDFDQLKTGDKRYIIGRKGTGKTAIIEQLTNDIKNTFDNFYSYLSLKSFPVQSIRELKDRTMSDKSKYVPIWSFLIINELGRLIISDESAKPDHEIVELRQYYAANFDSQIGFIETIKQLESSQNKLSIPTKWLGLENLKSNTKEILTTIHYQKVSDILLDKLKNIQTESKFYLFFDELDEGYQAGDSNLRLIILSLLRAVENTFIILKSHINFRPVLALRSDIFDNLEDNDVNKLDDYTIRLKWTTDSKSPYSLLDLVNKRISASIEIPEGAEPWDFVVDNTDFDLPNVVKSLWAYIYVRTFERPRDIVKFLKYCSKQSKNNRLKYQDVKSAEQDYSNWFYNEFRDEIQSHFPIWKEVMECLITLGRWGFTLDEIKPELENHTTVANWLLTNKKRAEDILKILFDFGVIGTISPTGVWLFKYKDHDLPYNSRQKMIVHFGFARKLRLVSVVN